MPVQGATYRPKRPGVGCAACCSTSASVGCYAPGMAPATNDAPSSVAASVLRRATFKEAPSLSTAPTTPCAATLRRSLTHCAMRRSVPPPVFHGCNAAEGLAQQFYAARLCRSATARPARFCVAAEGWRRPSRVRAETRMTSQQMASPSGVAPYVAGDRTGRRREQGSWLWPNHCSKTIFRAFGF